VPAFNLYLFSEHLNTVTKGHHAQRQNSVILGFLFTLRVQPVFWQKFFQGNILVLRNNDSAFKVPCIKLSHCLSATTTWRQNPAAGHGYYKIDLGFSVLQHFGDRRNFCTESKAACQVDTNTRIDISFRRAKGRADSTRRKLVSKFESTADASRCLNEL
jgi:hypothetical protein